MPFPPAAVAVPAELAAGAFDAPAFAPGFALVEADGDAPEAGAVAADAGFAAPAFAPGFAFAGAGEDAPEADGAAAEGGEAPPRLLT